MMKKTILGLALAATGIAGVAIAQAPGPMGDMMGDKTITRAEAQTKAAEMFDRMDANNDGSISRAEFTAAHQRMGGPGDDDRMGERGGKRGGKHRMGGMGMMGQMADANKDGAITKDEFVAGHLRMFDAADTNKDGKLTPAERKAHHQKMRSAMGKGDHAGHDMPPPPPPAN
ncbi:MAG: EF-hand domain-containing protein [Novosphingobium sp.]